MHMNTCKYVFASMRKNVCIGFSEYICTYTCNCIIVCVCGKNLCACAYLCLCAYMFDFCVTLYVCIHICLYNFYQKLGGIWET